MGEDTFVELDGEEHPHVPLDLLTLYEVLEFSGKITLDEQDAGTPLSADGRILSRGGWRGREPRSVSTNITPSTGGVAWHWEGPGMGSFPHSSCPTKVRGIQAYHMDSKKWADIAYNAMYCPHGVVFQGRWFGVRSAAQGTNDGNQRYYSVCYLGGEGDPFTPQAEEAAKLFRALATDHGKAGSNNLPHSAFHSTECPGDVIRVVVKKIGAGAFPTNPLPSSGPVKPMIDPPLRADIVAWLVHPLTGGVAHLLVDGGVLAWNAPYCGNVKDKPYFAGRKPARLEINPKWVPSEGNGGLGPAHGQQVPWYVIRATNGDGPYGVDGFPTT
jgi:N-acetylmuramoyl-L-alanine amidase